MILMTDSERFELYIALRRFRTEMWRALPPLVFVRWLFNKHPRMVVPFATALAVLTLAVILLDSTWGRP